MGSDRCVPAISVRMPNEYLCYSHTVSDIRAGLNHAAVGWHAVRCVARWRPDLEPVPCTYLLRLLKRNDHLLAHGGVSWLVISDQPVQAVTSAGRGVLLGRAGLELSGPRSCPINEAEHHLTLGNRRRGSADVG